MPTVEFFSNELGPAVTATVPDGGPMVDICDDVHAPVAFSCRSASCGICRVTVVAGASLLEPPTQEEIDVLEIFAATKAQRLACRAVVQRGPGLIQLKWVND
jgi:2Fe-2S ferredoxin